MSDEKFRAVPGSTPRIVGGEAPPARKVIARDGVMIATYEFGDPDAPTVLAVHGFASSALLNWHLTGWTRDLVRADFHVIAIDQRGHGASDKPHDPRSYSMPILVEDVLTVLDTFLLGEVHYLGYSLGGRVGWQASIDLPDRITDAVLGGIPDGLPLTRFQIEEARSFIEHGVEADDRLTKTYLDMASGIRGNDLTALVSLVEGMQFGVEPDPANGPKQPVLFATGGEDSILAASKRLADATPTGTFFEIPGRNHFNAPTSRVFRDAAIQSFSSSR